MRGLAALGPEGRGRVDRCGYQYRLTFDVVTPSGSSSTLTRSPMASSEAEMLQPWRKSFPICMPYGTRDKADAERFIKEFEEGPY